MALVTALARQETLGLAALLLVVFELLEEEGHRAYGIAGIGRGKRRLFARIAGSAEAILLWPPRGTVFGPAPRGTLRA